MEYGVEMKELNNTHVKKLEEQYRIDDIDNCKFILQGSSKYFALLFTELFTITRLDCFSCFIDCTRNFLLLVLHN